MRLRARLVLPVCGPPIENGVVEIAGDRIVDVGRSPKSADRADRDFGDAAILPGFVNAHTHLELSNLAGEIPTAGHLTDWLRGLVAALRSSENLRTESEAAASSGIGNSIQSGVTAVGDITRAPGVTRPVLARSPIRGVSFGEVIAIGALRERAQRLIDEALVEAPRGSRIAHGISPHAPYTVEPDALVACAHRARSAGARVCIHTLETPDEIEFTHSAGGALATYLRELGTWDEKIPATGRSPIQLLDDCGLLGPHTLLAHANYASPDDIQRIAERGASVAFCPRTHAAFRHDPHPFREMRGAGVNVCLGTDSLASNPSLSILDEMRFLANGHSDLSPTELIEMGTQSGAIALGLETAIGALRPGAFADLAVVALPPNRRDPAEALLLGDADVCATMIGGRIEFEA